MKEFFIFVLYDIIFSFAIINCNDKRLLCVVYNGSKQYRVSSKQYEMGFAYFVGSKEMNKSHFVLLILLTLYCLLPL